MQMQPSSIPTAQEDEKAEVGFVSKDIVTAINSTRQE
jgi:hypothetical protein